MLCQSSQWSICCHTVAHQLQACFLSQRPPPASLCLAGCPWTAGTALPQTWGCPKLNEGTYIHRHLLCFQNNDRRLQKYEYSSSVLLNQINVKDVTSTVYYLQSFLGNKGSITFHSHCSPSFTSCSTFLLSYWFFLIRLLNHFHMNTCLSFYFLRTQLKMSSKLIIFIEFHLSSIKLKKRAGQTTEARKQRSKIFNYKKYIIT